MNTISVPSSKLIKYIPSPADGGVIPGSVKNYTRPSLTRISPFAIRLTYVAASIKATAVSTCDLDEELEVVTGSNKLNWSICEGGEFSYDPAFVDDDGVRWELRSGIREQVWEDKTCVVADMFDSFGPHTIRKFTPFLDCQISPIVFFDSVKIAIIKKNNTYTLYGPIDIISGSKQQVTCGEFFNQGTNWIIPWSTPSSNLNLLLISERELSEIVRQ